MNENRQAFLDMLSVSEGTSTSPATQNNGYDVIVTGVDGVPEVFTDYSDHPFANGRPPKQVNSAGLYSTASGRYQQMLHWWPAYKKQLNLADFGPPSQDLLAIQLIRECQALPLIDAGSFDDAVHACRSRWASLPGAGYGQFENSMDKLRAAYVAAGGELA